MAQDTGRLTRDDTILCKNVEVFEVDTPNTTDPDGNTLALGTVGLRCIHCIGDRTSAGDNACFPSRRDDMGDCLRMIAERHLWRCERAPQAVKEILHEALKTRKEARRTGGPPWFSEESNRRLLLDYCNFRADEMRMADKIPTGLGVYIAAPLQHPGAGVDFPSVRYDMAQMSAGSTSGTMMSHHHPLNQSYGPTVPQGGYHPYLSSAGSEAANESTEPLPFDDQHSSSLDNTPSPNFPFVREASGSFVCKFCLSLPSELRDPGYEWSASNMGMPTADFVDRHLNVCRMYQQSLMQDFPGLRYASMYPPESSIQQGIPASHSLAEFDNIPMQQQIYPPGTEIRIAPSKKSPPRDLSADTPANRAMILLDEKDMSSQYVDGTSVPEHLKLVNDDDSLLITNYYFYLMKQLRPCRFTEADRRTRGGKRDNVMLGYGGLECVHCARSPSARKFFWSNVDRLANSFAEIPNHILKCRSCTKEIQDALKTLKETHQEQMSKLPRGAQKTYFRRMWQRVHKEDALPLPQPITTNSSPASAPPRPERLEPLAVERLAGAALDSPATQASEESVVLLERTPIEGARALVDSLGHLGPPSPTSRVLLSTPNDREWLSERDVLIRQQVEVFCATREDVDNARGDKKGSIEEGTVGLRCIHCALSSNHEQDPTAVSFPFSTSGLYESVNDLYRVHLTHCKKVPQSVRLKLSNLKGSSSLSSICRNYYSTSAKSLGLVDTRDGIRASGRSIPLTAQAALHFSHPQMRSPRGESEGLTPRKRSSSEPSPRPTQEIKRSSPFFQEEPSGSQNVSGIHPRGSMPRSTPPRHEGSPTSSTRRDSEVEDPSNGPTRFEI